MARFFVNTPLLVGESIDLPVDVVRHLHVLRLQDNGVIELFNGDGIAYTAKLGELNKKTAQAKKKNIKKGELIYMGINEIDKKVFKVGITCNASSRMSGLSCGTTTDFEMKHIWYTNFNKEIE